MDSTERIQILRRTGFGDHLISAMLDADPADLAAAALDPEFPLTLGQRTALGPLTVGLVDIPDTFTLGPDSDPFGGGQYGQDLRSITPEAWNTPALNLQVGLLFWFLSYDLATADFDPDDSSDAGMVAVYPVNPDGRWLTHNPLMGDYRMMEVQPLATRPEIVNREQWVGQYPPNPADVSSTNIPGPVRIQAIGAHMNADWNEANPPHSTMTFSNLRLTYVGI